MYFLVKVRCIGMQKMGFKNLRLLEIVFWEILDCLNIEDVNNQEERGVCKIMYVFYNKMMTKGGVKNQIRCQFCAFFSLFKILSSIDFLPKKGETCIIFSELIWVKVRILLKSTLKQNTKTKTFRGQKVNFCWNSSWLYKQASNTMWPDI